MEPEPEPQREQQNVTFRSLLNVASLVVSSTPGTMWKALQKIARVFGLKATKGKATIDGKRNCFRCVEVSISPGMLELVSMWTIYDRRCAPHRRVPVSEWQTHCEELGSDTIERQY